MKYTILILLSLLCTSLSYAFPIQDIQNRIQYLEANDIEPVCLFDLDETLIHSAKRKVLSYLKAIDTNRAMFTKNYPQETLAAEQALGNGGGDDSLILTLPNQYDSAALFGKMGISNTAFIHAIDQLMLPIYLSNDFISQDTAYRGAIQLLKLFYSAHGKVFFVTSRYESSQSIETFKNLVDNHLYRNSAQSHVLMRKDGEISIDFKKRAYQEVLRELTPSEQIVLVGENEPENMNAMMNSFPNAVPVFVTGAILNTKVEIQNNPLLILTKNFIRD